MKTSPPAPAARGMVIFEVLAALLIFGLAATSLMRCITASAQTAITAQQNLRMLLRLQSRLNEVSKYPDIAQLYEERPVETSDPDELGVWTRTEITLLEDIITEIDKQPVNDMYHVKVTAFYEDFGRTGEVEAETVRYARLYSTQGAAGGGGAQIPQPPQPAR